MAQSPLTQDARPDYFQPKIVQLYEVLLHHDDTSYETTEGFWREFFLLRPDRPGLINCLDSLSPDDLLHIRSSTQSLFLRCIQEAQGGQNPQNTNAFETLTALLGGVFPKRYNNPSSDVIEVLAGLDEIDGAVSSLVACIDNVVRKGESGELRRAAISSAISMVSGAYQTGLVSYFTHRDLFPALMKFVHDEEPQSCFGAFLLLGLLANHNKFEMQNPYQLRFEDFVNEAVIQRVVRSVAVAASIAKEEYVTIHDDLPEGWTLNSTLVFLGLRRLAPGAKPTSAPPSDEEAKLLYATLPGVEAALLLSTYSFVNANKVFATNLAALPAPSKATETPFSAFLSLASYLGHHAYRSERCFHYSLLAFLTLRIMAEDTLIMKRLTSSDSRISVRLCRQRAPHLPLITGDRIPVLIILDICITTISHNLRKRLDVPLYHQSLVIIHRVLTNLSRHKLRLQHHWSYIWGSLLSLLRFLTQYSTELLALNPDISSTVCTPLTSLLAFALTTGDTFLPSAPDYDDLLYKLVQAGQGSGTTPEHATNKNTDAASDILNKFATAFNLTNEPSIQTLLQISSHYQTLLLGGGKKQHYSPREVAAVIKQGYEMLDTAAGAASAADFGAWEAWREGEERALLKRIVRTVVEDARKWVGNS